MKKMFAVLVTALLFSTLAGLAVAAAPADDAKALVEKAAAYYQANGKEKAIKAFNDPKGEFVKGDLYVFAWDMNGVSVVNPYNPKQLGINVVNLPDVDGKYYRKEAMEVIKKSGATWADYKFKNPKTGKVEHKTSYLKKAGDVVLGCGVYK